MAKSTASKLTIRALDYMSRSAAATSRSGTSMETMALAWANDAQIRLSKLYDFRELYLVTTASVVDSGKTYAFPSNYKSLIDIRVLDDSRSRKLKPWLPRTGDAAAPMPENDSEGLPVWYMPFGTNFEVYPISDTTYTTLIRTIQWPTTLTSTNDSLSFDVDKDDVLLAFMLSEGFKFLQMWTDATAWEKVATARFLEAKRLELNQPDWMPKPVGFNVYMGGYYYPNVIEDSYDTASSEWIVNPFLKCNI